MPVVSEPSSDVHLVAIGASAGGVEAVGRLLQALPATTAVAIAVVLHVPADRPSQLAELFGERCARPVKEAEDKETIVGGTVYIAPPNYHLLVESDGSFSLSLEDAVLYSRPSIDLLLESAAYAYGEHLLGIVLTGASSDGAQGLAKVRDCGGRAWVQDPATARARMMPQAALELAQPHRVLDLKTLEADLADLLTGKTR